MTDQPIPPMVEKVAFAIFCASFHPDDVASGLAAQKWVSNEWPDDTRRAYRSAPAALRALAEPDEGMVEAGWSVAEYSEEHTDYSGKDNLSRAFTAMIKAAGGGE